MRGRKNNNRSNERRHRRCLLAGLLVASGQVTLADSPVATAPLPLAISSGQEAGQMQINPFCQPVPAAQGELEKLEPRAVEVREEQIKIARWTSTPGIRRTHPASIIQLPPGEPLVGRNFVVQSSGWQYDAPLHAAEDGASRSPRQDSIQTVSGGVRSNPLATPLPMPVSDVRGVRSLGAVERPPITSGPVSFMFSDDNDAPIETTAKLLQDTRTGLVRPPVIRPLVARSAAGKTPAAQQPAGVDSKSRSQSAWRGSSVQADGPSPILARPTSSSKTILVPVQETPDAHSLSADANARAQRARSLFNDEPRLVNGSRPKVEVGRPPLAIERENKLSLIADLQTKPSAKPAVSLPEPTVMDRLHFKPTEVRGLKTENTIQRIEIKSAAVCAAVKTGPNQVQLIATGVGVTQLNLWTVDQDGKEHHELYEIHVAKVQTAQVDGFEDIAATLTQSVSAAFPHSKVVVHHHGGRLMATGTCENEESARCILRMIRSACQMPVDDKVLVR